MATDHLTDAEIDALYARYREHGDIDARNAIVADAVTRHGRLIGGIARRRFRGKAGAADELRQEAAMIAIGRLPDYDPSRGASLSTFLYMAISLDLPRAGTKVFRSRRRDISAGGFDAWIDDDLIDRRPGPEQIAADAESRDAVASRAAAMLSRLAPDDAAVLRSYFGVGVPGRTCGEIGRDFGVGGPAVSRWINVLLRSLQDGRVPRDPVASAKRDRAAEILAAASAMGAPVAADAVASAVGCSPSYVDYVLRRNGVPTIDRATLRRAAASRPQAPGPRLRAGDDAIRAMAERGRWRESGLRPGDRVIAGELGLSNSQVQRALLRLGLANIRVERKRKGAAA